MADVDLTHLKKANASLLEAVSTTPRNDLERDGAIQRFEYTFELAWKTIRKCLIAMGRANVSGSPKPILRDALQEGFISSLGPWVEFLEARNLLANCYNAAIAAKVFTVACRLPGAAEDLLQMLEKSQHGD